MMYEIDEMGICYRCLEDWIYGGGLEKIVNKNNMRDENGSIKPEYYPLWKKYLKGEHLRRKCIVFYGYGNSEAITICEKHLREALKEITGKEE